MKSKKRPIIEPTPRDFRAWCEANNVSVADLQRVTGCSQRQAYRYRTNVTPVRRPMWEAVYRDVKGV